MEHSNLNPAGPGPLTRRRFLQTAGTAVAAMTVVPRSVLGGAGQVPPSGKPVVAGVGIGGVGSGQIQACERAGFHVGVLCDLDEVYAQKTYDRYPQARRYRDYREMFEAEGDKIDAVYCGTPDHTHALISLAALQRRKHVLTVKPLTRTVWEGRVLAQAVAEAGVMTQMTASSAATESGCRTCEMVWDGAVGPIREVHIWSDRPFWPQGMTRPPGSDPVPDTFDWELWLGPAPKRPFKEKWPQDSMAVIQTNWGNTNPAVYHPWNFRGWYDFGTGALGDMGCHHFNIPWRALKLGYPSAVSASSTRVMEETWPLASIVTWEFPARADMPPVKIVWYDGGLKPPRPTGLDANQKLPGMGILYVGEDGAMIAEGAGSVPQIISGSNRDRYQMPPKTLPRRPGIYEEWFEAVKGGDQPSEHWTECAVPLTEIVLLGNVALRMGGQRLEYDGPALRFTNSEEATKLLKADYQNGWKLG